MTSARWLRNFLPLAACAAMLIATGRAAPERAPVAAGAGRIVRLDGRFDALVPADARLEKIVDGHKWLEGPLWNRERRALLFSDIPQNTIFEWREGTGVRAFHTPAGYSGTAPFKGREPGSNGLSYDPQGRLVICQHGDRRIARLNADGSLTTLVDRYQGKRLNSPNDAAYNRRGDLYFTDPPFGLPGTFEDPQKEIPFTGVYRLSREGKLTLLTRELKFANGIAFSPDEKTLYVTNADPARPQWFAFPVKADGTLGAPRLFFDGTHLIPRGPGSADGMKADAQGNLFAAGPGGIHVFSSDGSHIGSIEIGSATSNCAWGGEGSTLYITAGTAIYRIRLDTKGAGL